MRQCRIKQLFRRERMASRFTLETVAGGPDRCCSFSYVVFLSETLTHEGSQSNDATRELGTPARVFCYPLTATQYPFELPMERFPPRNNLGAVTQSSTTKAATRAMPSSVKTSREFGPAG